MKYRTVSYFGLFFLFGFLFAVASVNAQTVGYRQTNLASDLPNMAHTVTPNLINPWGIAFLPGQPFFIADNKVGRVTVHDISGSGAGPIGFTVPNAGSTGFDAPIGIVADQNSFFGGPSLVRPFILVAEQGAIFTWGPDSQGDLPETAKLVVDNSLAGAVYKGAAILNSLLTAPALAVANFHDGSIDAFLPGFRPVALPGSFADPNLPAGYAPFGIQVIGNQVFVSYAVQDAAKHDPIFAPGNGIVSIFNPDGNFVRRFITGGVLNAPWGITQASGNFGPFSDAILIANAGDGTINAFDGATGEFRGQIKDGDGNTITNKGIHGLTFRTDGFGDSNTLYFTAGINSGQDGLLGTITTGLVSSTRLNIPQATTGIPATITVETSAGTDNPGTPTGLVVVQDGGVVLSSQALVNGAATFDTVFTTSGSHTITVRYSGDANFLPGSSRVELQVLGLTTTLALTAPATAAPNSTVVLTATIASTGGVPTGQILFLDGTTGLGTVSLDDSGVAILRINTLAAGLHSLSVSYSGDEKFSSSTSAAVTLTIASPDFSFRASPAAATVIAGQSAQFVLSVSPAAGFSSDITFSCTPTTGITCAFSPAVLNPSNAATVTLHVTTSADILHFGFLLFNPPVPCAILFGLFLLGFAMRTGGKIQTTRASLLAGTAAAAIVVLGLVIGGCGGYSVGLQPGRGTASIVVTAASGAISHNTTVKVTVQ